MNEYIDKLYLCMLCLINDRDSIASGWKGEEAQAYIDAITRAIGEIDNLIGEILSFGNNR